MTLQSVIRSSLIVLLALSAAGCGSGESNSANTAAPAPTTKTAKSINSALIFSVKGSDVAVGVSGKQGTPKTDLPAQVVCAKLAGNGFADRNEAAVTWKKGATSVSVTLPKSAASQDLCAISFTTLKKQAVAFFNEAAKKKYLADAEGAG